MEDVATHAYRCGGGVVGVFIYLFFSCLLSSLWLLCDISCFLPYLQFCDVPLLGLGKVLTVSSIQAVWKVGK